jgi:large subunit ribosomal protein L4
VQVPVYNRVGEVVDHIEVDEGVFGIQPNKDVVHQALVAQRANSRVGTVETKTRAQVSGSARKLYRQKHTGFARAGSRRSPTRRGGGIAFGPHRRDYRQSLPRKMRRLALRSVLSGKLADGELKVIDSFGLDGTRTREVVGLIQTLGATPSALLVTANVDVNIVKSARNIKRVKTLPAYMLNVADMLTHRMLIITVNGVRQVESVWGGSQAAGSTGTQG